MDVDKKKMRKLFRGDEAPVYAMPIARKVSAVAAGPSFVGLCPLHRLLLKPVDDQNTVSKNQPVISSGTTPDDH